MPRSRMILPQRIDSSLTKVEKAIGVLPTASAATATTPEAPVSDLSVLQDLSCPVELRVAAERGPAALAHSLRASFAFGAGAADFAGLKVTIARSTAFAER